MCLFFDESGYHRVPHVLSTSIPPRRASDRAPSCLGLLLRLGDGPGADDLGARDPVGDVVARHLQPQAAALAVVPVLEVPAARIVAIENVVAPVVGGRTCRVRALLGGVAAVGELADVARAAVRAGDQHGGSPRLAAVPIDLVLRDAPQRPWAGPLDRK